MSSIQTAPVEILLDMFQANDPAGTEALQLTCRRFHDTIVQKELRLYRTPPNNAPIWSADRESIASSSWQRHEVQHLYETFGRKTAIHTVRVIVPDLTEPNGPLTQLIDDFPSVKGAVRLCIDTWAASDGFPTDPVLDHFDRLETILMDMRACDKAPIVLEPPFASKAFRRVPNFIMVHNLAQRPAVDDGELFNFITDFSCMPANKPRLVLFARLDTDTVDALERRFDEST